MIKTLGSSSDPEKIKELVKQAKRWIDESLGSLSIDFSNEFKAIESVLDNVEGLKLIGLDLLLGKIFDDVGFNRIPDPYLRYLVIYRLVYPKSKLQSVVKKQ